MIITINNLLVLNCTQNWDTQSNQYCNVDSQPLRPLGILGEDAAYHSWGSNQKYQDSLCNE